MKSKVYKEIQIGFLLIALMAVGIFTLIYLIYVFGFNIFFLFMILVLFFFLVLFSNLAIEIDKKEIRISMGGGLYSKIIKLADIKSYEIHDSPLYYDWGIRPIENGWMYSILGFDSVAITLNNGEKYIIGTDQPHALMNALKKFNTNSVEVTKKPNP